MKFCLQLFLLFFLFPKIAIGQTDTVINQRLNLIENSSNLSYLFSILKENKGKPNSKFVVAHFGDSHIQGDHFSGTIRKNLQGVFGAAGEGLLFPYSVCKSFGPKSLSTAITGNWNYATILNNPNKYPIGVTGYTLVTTDKSATMSFVYNPSAELDYNQNKIYEKAIVWHSKKNFKIKLIANGAADGIFVDTVNIVNGLYQTIISNYRTGMELKFQFDTISTDTLFNFHGISFVNNPQFGLQYLRCGVVGGTFIQLVAHQEFTIAHLKEIKPDLLIFSYGSNESYLSDFDKNLYYDNISLFIKLIQKELPKVCIIFTSTPDTRSRNRFPINTKVINENLRNIANENSAAFWDLNKIMGGNNSILFWLTNGLAAKDKLHFTKTGYALQGDLFSFSFLQLYNNLFDKSIQNVCDTIQYKINFQLKILQIDSDTVVFEKKRISNFNSDIKNYHVKKNDTLSGIAKKYGVTVSQLCIWNKLTEKSVLQINQLILIKK